ncbi:tyrosine-protein phosphatase 11-like [Saccostrea cucullata]|uniref:tyrosine-protein phosphatase 11-like n=1 Tax=Saccostrea cuccullata TaxID=36930 RepID=UPI002ED44C1B
MIWQENIQNVVMLTNLIENGKNKCIQYWPNKEQPMAIGPCKIDLLNEKVYAFWTIRKLSVQRKNPPSKRIITQFHYTAWPDHDTPNEVELVQFHRFVSKKMNGNTPTVVHCR